MALKKNIEVLYLVDPIDEYVMQHLADFEGNKLQSLTKEGVKFGDEDEDTIKKRTKAYREAFKPLTKYMKDLLGAKISKVLSICISYFYFFHGKIKFTPINLQVTVSQRVDKTPSIIVSSQYGQSANMERIMRAQTFADSSKVREMVSSRTLELNPRHPIISKLNKLIQESPDDEVSRYLSKFPFAFIF